VARDIDSDLLWLVVLRVEFLLNGGEGAEEEAAGKGHNGGVAGSDLVAGLEFIEFPEGVVDVDGGAEFLDVADEGGGNVGLIEVLLEQSGVFGAEAGVLVGDGHATKAATGGGTVLAMEWGGAGDGGARSFWIHMSSFLGILRPHPAVFVRVANKGDKSRHRTGMAV
jgi:hypothetical protein